MVLNDSKLPNSTRNAIKKFFWRWQKTVVDSGSGGKGKNLEKNNMVSNDSKLPILAKMQQKFFFWSGGKR